jgi:rhodanese-related sulfurtransferase
MKNPQKIHPLALEKIISKNPGAQLIDVHTSSEFEEVHVPKAILHPLATLNAASLESDAQLSKEKPLYILCRSGARASTAAVELFASGFKEVFIVDGGTEAWVQNGLPVIRGSKQGLAIERQFCIGAGVLVLGSTLLGFFVNAAFLAFTAFIGVSLIFGGLTNRSGDGLGKGSLR